MKTTLVSNRWLLLYTLALAPVPAIALQLPPPSAQEYRLGPLDEIVVQVEGVDEISDKPIQIEMGGEINLPMAGRILAAGLTSRELEALVCERLKQLVRNPQVSVSIRESKSQPVSVLGAVNNPGVHQLSGHKTLYEILSMAGGLKTEAGNTIRLTRLKQWGAIPLKSAHDDPSGQFSLAEVSVRSVMEGLDPLENVRILPNDVISIPKADIVYVIGSVRRAGGFPLNEREPITALQALSLAEGLDRGAAPRNARILRVRDDSPTRAEIPVNLKRILSGDAGDVALQPNDILFVPTSAPRNVGLRTLEVAIQLGTGIMIYRR